MDMISVSKLALKNVSMENVAKDQIINAFVIWDTVGLIVIQIVGVMGTPFVTIWDQVSKNINHNEFLPGQYTDLT